VRGWRFNLAGLAVALPSMGLKASELQRAATRLGSCCADGAQDGVRDWAVAIAPSILVELGAGESGENRSGKRADHQRDNCARGDGSWQGLGLRIDG